MGLCTRSRLPARHTSPWFVKMPLSEPDTASLMSASAMTMLADFPPISNDSFFNPAAALAMIARPVLDSPVKVMASTSGCTVIASPAAPGPKPCTTLNTPGGMPASAQISARIEAVIGDCSAGLATTVHPKARAGATFHVSSMSGKFHGEIEATTPSGSRSS